MLSDGARRLLLGLQGLYARTQDEEGQTLAEYGLILSVVAVATIVAAGIAFRGAIIGAFNSATGCLDGTC
jgi:Flp pilus assembly pilin Flp